MFNIIIIISIISPNNPIAISVPSWIFSPNLSNVKTLASNPNASLLFHKPLLVCRKRLAKKSSRECDKWHQINTEGYSLKLNNNVGYGRQVHNWSQSKYPYFSFRQVCVGIHEVQTHCSNSSLCCLARSTQCLYGPQTTASDIKYCQESRWNSKHILWFYFPFEKWASHPTIHHKDKIVKSGFERIRLFSPVPSDLKILPMW